MNAKFRGNQPSLWNFWEHGVTQSMLGSFMTCREQCRIKYVEGLRPKIDKDYFIFGSAGHYCIQRAYEHAEEFVEAPLEGDVDGWLTEFEAIYREEIGSMSAKQEEEFQWVLAIVQVVMEHYFQWWAGDFTGDYSSGGGGVTEPHEWVGQEEVLRVPYEYPDGAVTYLTGKLDGVFLDKRGRLWLKENKFYGRFNEAVIERLLPWDFQTNMYLLMLTETYEEKVAGCIYDVTRKPGQRRLTSDTIHSFASRVRAAMEKDGGARYFNRFEMPISMKDVRAWKAETLDPLMQDVRAWWDGTGPHYACHARLKTPYGGAADEIAYFEGDKTQFAKKKVPFTELESEI